jgi:photosystem II stability/assembly factor-like uncharacterized protein
MHPRYALFLGLIFAMAGVLRALTAQQAPPWQEQKSGTTARLRGLSVVDANVVWASGTSGTFVRTVDGGAHWQPSIVPGAEALDFRDVHGVNANTAYLLSIGEGEKSRIYKTADGGHTWTLQFTNHEPKAFFDGFAFWDAANGIAFSDPVDGRFLIIRTNDGGSTWKDVPRENRPPAMMDEAAFAASGSSITVAGANDVWIATGGSAARVLHSTDRGLTWSAATTPITSGVSSAGIFSIFAATPQSLFVVGGDFQKEKEASVNFARSSDGGRTWMAGPQLPGYRSAIHATSGPNGVAYIAVGPSGTDLLRSGGAEWINNGTVGYDAVSFIPGSSTGWAAGQSGRIGKWQVRP